MHWATESEKYIILTLFYDQNYVNLSNLKFHPLCHTKSSFFWKSPRFQLVLNRPECFNQVIQKYLLWQSVPVRYCRITGVKQMIIHFHIDSYAKTLPEGGNYLGIDNWPKKIHKLFSKFIHYYHVNNSMKARFLKFLLNEKQNWPSSQVELPNVLLSPAISMKMIEMLFKSW